MKKIYLAIELLLAILFISFSVNAANVALVVKDADSLSTIHEREVKNALLGLGHTITYIDKDSNVTYSDYDLIVIAGRPGNIGESLDPFVADIPVNDYPTIAIDYYYPDDWGWATSISNQYSLSQPHSVYVSNTTHPITQGYTGKVTVHVTTGVPYLKMEKTNTALSSVADSNSVGDYGVILFAESGTELTNETVTKNRIVFFGITYPFYWTGDASEMFENSVDWVLAGESIGEKEMDVDDDGVDEKAINSDDNMTNGYEAYEDPNSNSVSMQLDGDDDGKADHLIDVGKTGVYEKYWDPDDELLTDVFASGEYYVIDIDGGMPDKVLYNGTLSALKTIEYDVDSNGVNETILDVNDNNETDVYDMIWDEDEELVYSLPDIAVTDITFSNDNPDPSDSVTVTAVIEKNGYDAGDFLVEFLVDGSLKSSTTTNSSVDFSWTAVAGAHEIRIRLDSNSMIFESDEGNNERAESLTVNSPQPPPPPPPPSGGGSVTYTKDVVIIAQNSIEIEGEYIFVAEVMNTGNLNADVTLEASGMPCKVTPNSAAIVVGEKKSFTVTLKPESAGSYNLVLKAYSGSLLDEKTIAVTVKEEEIREPVIIIAGISAEVSGSLSMVIKNIGNELGAVTAFLVLPEGLSAQPEEIMISLNPEEEKAISFTLELPGTINATIEAQVVYYDSSGQKTVSKSVELFIEAPPLTGMATFVGDYIIIFVAAIVAIAASAFYLMNRHESPWSSALKTSYASNYAARIPKPKSKTTKMKWRVVS